MPQSRPILERIAKRSRAKQVVVKETKRKIRKRVAIAEGKEIVESKKECTSQDSHMDVDEDANDATKDDDSDGNIDGVLQLLEKRSKMSNAKKVQITIRIFNRLQLRATQVMECTSLNLHGDVLIANYSFVCSLCWLC